MKKVFARTDKSITKRSLVVMLIFGLCMGLIFPVYANFFVNWIPGLRIWFIVGSIMAGLSVGIINFIIVKIFIFRAIKAMNAKIGEISATHNLNIRVDLESDDELGEISDNFNLLMEEFKRIISHVTENCQSVFSVTSNIAGSIDDTNISVQQIAGGAKNQTSSMEKSTQALKGIGESNASILGQTDLIDQKVHRFHQNIEMGNQSMAKATSAMDNIEISSLKREEIVDVIKKIAKQSSLLAFNAEIEATKAGEHGKGFSIVADKVQQLAKRSLTSAREINELISEDRENIELGVNTIKDVGGYLNEMVSEINEITKLFDAVAKSMLEQNKAIVHISDNMDHVYDISKDHESITEQVFNSIKKLGKIGKAMRSSTRDLQESVVEFKI